MLAAASHNEVLEETMTGADMRMAEGARKHYRRTHMSSE